MSVVAESSNLTLFLIGVAVGVAVSLAGGLVEYGLHLRRNREPRFGVPGCLVYTVGGLILAGVVAIIASFVLTGGIGPALIMGLGVMAGFYGGFILLVSVWLLLESLRPADNKAVPNDSTTP